MKGLRKHLRQVFGKGQKASTRPDQKTRPNLETLEDRQLMASSLTASFAGGVLHIEGTNKADTIVVRQVNNYLSVDGVNVAVGAARVAKVAAVSVKKIEVNAGDGNDKVYLNSDQVAGQQAITAAASLIGGGGDDILKGGKGINFIRGDDGCDTLIGGASNDQLLGGNGSDLLQGQAGNDQLWGGGDSSNNFLYGGIGNDDLMGGQGHDQLFGEAGTDRLWGEGGNDWLEAGSASEYADGGDGWDWNAHVWVIGGQSPDDIRQGEDGTCSFLSSLAACAQRGMDLGCRINYLGNYQYSVRLFKDGAWFNQVVDFGHRMLSTDPKAAVEGETWVILYQRAFVSAFRGQLDEHHSAWPGLPLTALTGQSSTSFRGPLDGTLNDAAFGYLESALKQCKKVVAVTNTSAEKNSTTLIGGNGFGIHTTHAYTVISVQRDQLGRPALVTVRNPWGYDGRAASGNAADGYITVTWATFKACMQGIWWN